MKRTYVHAAATLAAVLITYETFARPEDSSYGTQTGVTAAGEYMASEGTDFVLSGAISGDVAITATETSRVTLSNATVTGTITVTGDAEIWLEGASTVSTAEASAISVTGSLVLGGTGSLAASAAGAKKTGVIAVGGDFELAGGTTSLTISGTVKNACGVSMAGNYVQTAGKLVVTAAGSTKQNGVFLATKKTTATIAGGWLQCSLAGEKSVGLAMDKATINGTMTGGVLRFIMSGDGSKGVKGDGTFTMSGGLVNATLKGGVVDDLFEYEDDDGVTWNYYVKLTSSTKTSGGTSTYSTSKLIANGVYPVLDPAKCYAIKVGTLNVSGGTVRVRATGTAGRGLGADSMTLSGGFYDIAVSGGPTDVCVSMLDEENMTTTCLDSGSAACIKTGDEDGTMLITGGKFQLSATGKAGKLINAAGALVIGTEGQSTLPSDAAFYPDIQGSTKGAKTFCAALKQKYYGSLATPVATTNIAAMTLSTASSKIVSSSGDSADYSNPKGVKAETGITMHGGRLRVATASDGGEGFESKDFMTINGGVIELVCADDCINSGEDLTINDGYIYAASTGNDAIDSNGDHVYIKGGVVLAFTSSSPEVGIDIDSSSGLKISGGHVVSFGSAAGNMVISSSGTQKTYCNTTLAASTYAGKYLTMTGDSTFAVKIPSMTSTSGYVSLVCTTEGWSSAGTPTATSTKPSSGAIGFHGVYIQ